MGSPTQSAWRRAGPWALAVVCTGWALVVGLWEPASLALPFDDAWYYQTIARHLAAGDGFTHDGLQVTNGFHPLWQLLLVPVVALADGFGTDGIMRVTLVLQIILAFGGLVVLDRRLPGIALAGAVGLTNPYAFKAVVGGMESALLFALLALAVAQLERWQKKGAAVPSGLLLGAIALTRLEALAFVAAALGFLARDDRKLAFRTAAVVLVPVGLWTALAFGTFGTPIPVSGQHLSGAPRMGRAMVVGAVWLVLAPVALRLLRRTPLVAALAFHVGVQLAYVGIFQGRWLPSLWYLAPALLFAAIAAVTLSVRLPRFAVPAFVVLWLLGASFAWMHRVDPASYSSYVGARHDGQWLARHLADGEWAAGWDIGIVAARAGGRVANLEGLVAAPDFDPADVPGFLNAHPEIRYLVQFVRQGHLCHQEPLRYGGIELEHLPLVRTESVAFRAADPRMSTTVHRMIFDLRGDAAVDVARVRRRACE